MSPTTKKNRKKKPNHLFGIKCSALGEQYCYICWRLERLFIIIFEEIRGRTDVIKPAHSARIFKTFGSDENLFGSIGCHYVFEKLILLPDINFMFYLYFAFK